MINDDIGRNELIAVGVAHVTVSRAPVGRKRKNIMITNSSGGAHVITIHKGVGVAVSNVGIPLQPNGHWGDSTLNEKAECFQGTISVISDLAAGQISVSEEFE